jgi:hypothetical protein
MSTFRKDPSALLDYALDWSPWLVDDTIASVEWTVPTGLTVDSSSHTNTVATIWLAGGEVGQIYRLVCQITTQEGRIDQRSFTIRCEER